MLPLTALPQLRRGELFAGFRRALRRLDAFTLGTFDARTPSYRN